MKFAAIFLAFVCLLFAATIERLQSTVPTSFAPTIDIAAKSVVYIMTPGDAYAGVATPFAEDPWFRPYFLYPQLGLSSQKLRRSLGSGTIVSKNGLIVTSARFVEDRKALKVVVPGKPEPFDATIIGEDQSSGLAVLKIVANDLQEPKFADMGKLEAGELVFAIGNPFGLEPVVSMGIVSAIGKQSEDADERLMQSDLFIHGGNIGGAVINSEGEIVGVPVRLRGMTAREPQGGFFLPIDRVRSIARRIERYGEAKEAWLGIAVADLTQEMKSYYGRDDGVLITAVEAHSPADVAGLKKGDLLLLADSLIVGSVADFERIVSTLTADRDAVIMYIRDRKLGEAAVRVGRMESGSARYSGRSLYHHGMALENLTPALKDKFKIDPEISLGAVVTDIEANSAADKSGFREGDVIVQADGRDITSLAEFQDALNKEPLETFMVMRSGLAIAIDLTNKPAAASTPDAMANADAGR